MCDAWKIHRFSTSITKTITNVSFFALFCQTVSSQQCYYAAWRIHSNPTSVSPPQTTTLHPQQPASQLCRNTADRDEREDLWWAGCWESVQRLMHLQAVARHHRRERPAVEEAVSAGQSCLSEGGGQGQDRRLVLEGGFSDKRHQQHKVIMSKFWWVLFC